MIVQPGLCRTWSKPRRPVFSEEAHLFPGIPMEDVSQNIHHCDTVWVHDHILLPSISSFLVSTEIANRSPGGTFKTFNLVEILFKRPLIWLKLIGKCLLAHLSRRLIGELIGYSWSGVVLHNAQRSSSPKPLGQSKPNFMWSLLG